MVFFLGWSHENSIDASIILTRTAGNMFCLKCCAPREKGFVGVEVLRLTRLHATVSYLVLGSSEGLSELRSSRSKRHLAIGLHAHHDNISPHCFVCFVFDREKRDKANASMPRYAQRRLVLDLASNAHVCTRLHTNVKWAAFCVCVSAWVILSFKGYARFVIMYIFVRSV